MDPQVIKLNGDSALTASVHVLGDVVEERCPCQGSQRKYVTVKHDAGSANLVSESTTIPQPTLALQSALPAYQPAVQDVEYLCSAEVLLLGITFELHRQGDVNHEACEVPVK